MNPETLKIKCPNCGAVLTIRNMEGLENKSVTCPVCKKQSRYIDFKHPAPTPPPAEEDRTMLGGCLDTPTPQAERPGALVDEATGKTYPLSAGLNMIGRKAMSSDANVQIDTADRTMSRKHCAIEAKPAQGKPGYFHYLSNAENKNATYVGTQKLLDGDRIVLQGGEKIRMGGITLTFVKDIASR